MMQKKQLFIDPRSYSDHKRTKYVEDLIDKAPQEISFVTRDLQLFYLNIIESKILKALKNIPERKNIPSKQTVVQRRAVPMTKDMSLKIFMVTEGESVLFANFYI